MHALLLALVVSASGDPYILQTTDAHLLTSGERSTLASAVLARAPGLAIGSLLRMPCKFTDTTACCTPQSADTQTAAAVRTLLLNGVTWIPSPEADSQYKDWDDICVTGGPMNAFKTLIGNIDGTVAGAPIYTSVYERTPGTANVYQTVEYGVEGTEAWISTHMDEALVPMGVVP